MAAKMKKIVVKLDFRENPAPTRKVKRERISPASSMLIKRGVFGEDLKQRKK